MQLGGFQFGLSTAAYQELSWSTEYRWPEQDRIGQESALQFTGPGPETITLTGIIYAEFRAGRFQIEGMKAVAARGEPLMMTDGLGAVMGRWVIKKIDEKKSIFASGGVGRRQDFTMELRKFGDSTASPVSGALAAVPGGVTTSPLGGLASPVAGLSSSIQSTMGGALSMLNNARAALGAGFGQVQGALNGALSSALELNAGGIALGQVAQIAGLPTTLGGIVTSAMQMTRASTQVSRLAGLALGSPDLSTAARFALTSTQAAGGNSARAAVAVFQRANAILGQI